MTYRVQVRKTQTEEVGHEVQQEERHINQDKQESQHSPRKVAMWWVLV
jgi:hypothetical protein